MAEIYALSDPRDGVTRYIGKANDAQKRLKSHYRDAKRRRTPVYYWINSLLNQGVTVQCKVLCATDDWVFEEKRLIFEARLSGVPLLNLADGGDEPLCTAETRAKNGRKVSELHKDPVQRLIWEVKHRFGYMLKSGVCKPSTREKLLSIREKVWQDPLRFAPTVLGKRRCDAFCEDVENRLSQCPS